MYNVKEASVFKLSRLRVPRYRHFMQTVSFAIVLSIGWYWLMVAFGIVYGCVDETKSGAYHT